jgi:tripeptide aminopeptidase
LRPYEILEFSSLIRTRRFGLSGIAQDAARQTEDPTVKSALEAARRNEPQFTEEQVRICQIPAPPFHEDVRAKQLERLFQQLGLQNVRIDKAGKVIGTRPGAAAHPHLVIAAHLDTVFPEGTDVRVKRDVLKGCGIGDDSRLATN